VFNRYCTKELHAGRNNFGALALLTLVLSFELTGPQTTFRHLQTVCRSIDTGCSDRVLETTDQHVGARADSNRRTRSITARTFQLLR
jgi:hypothetical protein